MRRRRIQVRASWADDEEARRPSIPAVPVGQPLKWLASAGIVGFWLYFFGWIGPGGPEGLETGFLLFVACQVPLIWRWMRGGMGRRR